MTESDQAPGAVGGVDTTVASIARVYDAALFGKDNFAIDREVLDQVRRYAPEIPSIARDNRDWLIRVTRFLVGERGIDQFLDCGAGLPAAENTHEVAQRINPAARVLYVDNDPAVLAHGRALLEDNEDTRFLPADLTKPAEVMRHPDLRRHLNLSEPIALFQVSTLHHHSDEIQPTEIMRAYIDALPSGSYVALTHFFDPGDEDGELARRLEQTFLEGPMGSGYFRTREEIADMLPGLELLEPGLTLLPDWWPDGPRESELAPVQRCILGAVGRKP